MFGSPFASFYGLYKVFMHVHNLCPRTITIKQEKKKYYLELKKACKACKGCNFNLSLLEKDDF